MKLCLLWFAKKGCRVRRTWQKPSASMLMARFLRIFCVATTRQYELISNGRVEKTRLKLQSCKELALRHVCASSVINLSWKNRIWASFFLLQMEDWKEKTSTEERKNFHQTDAGREKKLEKEV
jgi:hypothetical protein